MSLTGDLEATRLALRSGALTAVELTEVALARAEALQESLGAFAVLTPELALAQARRVDEDHRAGRHRGPLHGLPLAVKDVIDVAGAPTGLGRATGGHRPAAADAAAVAAATRAGAVVIGKAATHGLALGMVTPQTLNPLDPGRGVGGSSGGSAAAVAAGICAVAIGTDTNGSVRCPAALTGVVGLKPTLGAVPRAGVAPLAWSQDTVGSMAATVADCAELHAVLAGVPLAEDWRAGPGGLRIGVDRAATRATAAPAVADAVLASLEGLADQGAVLVEVAMPDLALAGAASFVTILSEAASAWNHRRPDLEGLSPQVRAALAAGAELPVTAYLQAARVRTQVRRQLRALFASGSGLDALALPTVPVVAAPAGAAAVEINGRHEPLEAAYARYLAIASLSGAPALSVPCGVDRDGLPIGLQLIGAPGTELLLLRLGAALETLDGAAAVAAARQAAHSHPRKGQLDDH